MARSRHESTKTIAGQKVHTDVLIDVASSHDISKKWWLQEDDKIAQSVFHVINTIELNQLGRRSELINYARLYSSAFAGELFGSNSIRAHGNTRLPPGPSSPRLSLNVVKSAIDTICAKVSKSKPRPYFVTSNGDWAQQKRAKQANKFMDGCFYLSKLYPKAQLAFRDSTVFGYGAIKTYIDQHGQIQAERLIPDEVVVDECEGAFGNPNQMHQKRYCSRDTILATFGDNKHKQMLIHNATSAWVGAAGSRSVADQIIVVESWHLPSSPKAKDGKHVVCVEGCTLFEEAWTHDFFPIELIRWSPRLFGFFGTGLASELAGLQLEINRLLKNVQTAMYRTANPTYLVESSSNVSVAQLTNEIGAIIKYTGPNAPQRMAGITLPPEVYSQLENYYRKAFEIAGVSQMSAQGQKPPGIDSAVGLRELSDIQTERFALISQAYEEFIIAIAHKYLALADTVPDIQVNAVSRNGRNMEPLTYKEVRMDEDTYVLQCYPVNILPTTPAGRLQAVQELLQAGMIEPEQGRRLLDFPDLAEFTSLDEAALDHIHQVLDNIVEHGTYEPPEPFMGLGLAKKLCQAQYERAKFCGVEESRLQLLRQFNDDIDLLNQAAAPPPAPAPAPGPQAAPLPPPTSQLLPNAAPKAA